MNLHSTYHDTVNLIAVDDARIDSAVALRFKDDMRSLTEQGPDHIVLDLSRVTFVDSSGLGAIVASMKQLGPGKRLDLAGLTPDVAKVFRLTRMDTVFTIHPDASAVAPRAAG